MAPDGSAKCLERGGQRQRRQGQESVPQRVTTRTSSGTDHECSSCRTWWMFHGALKSQRCGKPSSTGLAVAVRVLSLLPFSVAFFACCAQSLLLLLLLIPLASTVPSQQPWPHAGTAAGVECVEASPGLAAHCRQGSRYQAKGPGAAVLQANQKLICR